MPGMVLIRLLLSALSAFLVATPAAVAGPLIDPGTFGPTSIRLEDGRVLPVPAETYAFYRMLTQDGRIHGKDGRPPAPEDVQAGILLRRAHEPHWAARFGARPRTPESAYVFPVAGGWLAKTSGYRPGHRAEDIFASPGQKVVAPATMLLLHAGYLSKNAGQAVVGFAPPAPGVSQARYFVFVHIDPSLARAKIGEVVEAGTVVGLVATGDEAVVGNALHRPPHVHFLIREEDSDGRLDGIPVWDLLRHAARHAASR